MPAEIKVALIGLDTSHTIQFAKLIQGDDVPSEARVSGLRVTKAMRFPSPFQTEPDQDKRQAQLEKWNIKVTRNFAEAVEGADALMLEINDPAQHLDYFRQASGLGKPIFLDKPMCATVEEGKAIIDLAKKHGTKVWSSSSLRFADELSAAKAEIPQPTVAAVYGPLGKAPAGSSLVWYGVHACEMLVALMGRGATQVTARKDACGIVLLVDYPNNRRGLVECNENSWFYGGRIQTNDKCRPIAIDGKVLYQRLMSKVLDFFQKGTIPVPLEETLEVQAILNAGDRSVASGKAEALGI